MTEEPTDARAALRTAPLAAIAAIGVGLALAPLLFQMFSRAPEGGVMLDEFRQYMTDEEIGRFEGYMGQIRAADEEARLVLEPALVSSGAVDGDGYDLQFSLVTDWTDQWPDIDADMTDLLDTMSANIDNFEAVDALPPFPLFPWFFVVPGIAVAVLAVLGIAGRGPLDGGRLRWVLVGCGIALVAAPLVFQMFTRAPKGADMIDDFRPMMVRERVQNVQGYFITMGGSEGQLRTAAVPLATAEADLTTDDLPAIETFSADWPAIVGDFAPMVATMSDNVDNFEAVDALPPFNLFPWFFVVPGILVALLAWRAGSDAASTEPA